jgi:hypothetical protein
MNVRNFRLAVADAIGIPLPLLLVCYQGQSVQSATIGQGKTE